MLKLFTKLFLLILITAIFHMAIIGLMLIDNGNRTLENSIYGKKMNMLRHASSPKIVLLGGSSVLFGLDSSKMSEEFGVTVINFGTHAGYGLKFMLDSVEPFLKYGDTLIISPEYSHLLTSGSYNGGSEIIKIFYCDNSTFHIINNYKQSVHILKYIPDFIIKYIILKQDIDNYNPSIDATGNYLWDKIEIKSRKISFKSEIEHGYMNNDAINDIVLLNNRLAAKGCKLYYDYPYVPCSIYLNNKSSIDILHHELKTRHITVLSAPNESVASDHYFYDTVYHLNPVGRILHTDFIVSNLRRMSSYSKIE